ncbi:MAG: mandelate racemase [Hyphomicrobiales bacterium]|nr:mandelate racemase [Hyphomicrobiales bacterium]MCP5372423.1 mandelate racemase [Hyphomicrobiales bacterium]
MRVRSLDIFRVSVPFVVPYKLSKLYGTVTHNQAVILRLETDTGVVGWGEADPLPPFTEETSEQVRDALHGFLGPALMDLDDLSVNGAHWAMDAVMDGNTLAKGAVDMAVHDAVARSLGVPVHLLLGGALHDAIPVMWPLGSGTAEDDAQVIEPRRAQGYRSFMVKMGSAPVADEVARVAALTERYPDIAFIADANQGWTEDEAMAFVDGVRPYPLVLLEQPVARSDEAALGRVAAAADLPVSADESVFTLADAARLAAAGTVDVFSVKVSKNGGIAPGRRIADLALAHGMGCLMNSMLELGISQAASLQLGATLGNLVDCGHAYMSTLRLADDVTDFSALVSGGDVRVPDTSGLGVTVDEAKVRSLAMDHVRLAAPGAAESAA